MYSWSRKRNKRSYRWALQSRYERGKIKFLPQYSHRSSKTNRSCERRGVLAFRNDYTMVSRFRSSIAIIGLTTNENAWRKLALSWGVIPAMCEKIHIYRRVVLYSKEDRIKGTWVVEKRSYCYHRWRYHGTFRKDQFEKSGILRLPIFGLSDKTRT